MKVCSECNRISLDDAETCPECGGEGWTPIIMTLESKGGDD